MNAAAIDVLADAEALAGAAADWLIERAAERREARFAVALSGGATPQRLYELLAEPRRRARFPWARAHWFWGDERFVPPDDPKSNFRMACEAMLARAPVPAGHVHPVPTVGMSPEEAASAYQRELVRFYGADRLAPVRPLFDVTLLGLGTDGHTASLFPGTAVLDERRAWVAAVIGAQPEPRVTLTYPVLESSRHVAFLIAGEGKRAAFARLRSGDETMPAARLRPAGETRIFVDRAAAGRAGGAPELPP